MSEFQGHPIRRASLHVFQRVDDHGGGTEYIARFHPYNTWPIFFSDESHDGVISKAEQFRTECINKHEASVLRRQAAKAARRKSKDARSALQQVDNE